MEQKGIDIHRLIGRIQDIVKIPLTAAMNDVFAACLPDLSNEELETLEEYFCYIYDPIKIALLVDEMKKREPMYVPPKRFNMDGGPFTRVISKQKPPQYFGAKCGINIVLHNS